MNTRKKTTHKETLIEKVTTDSLNQVQAVSETLEREFDAQVEPVREGVLKRFPALFLLLVTVGVVATMLGLEQLLLRYAVFSNQPFLLFITGVLILAFTGTLYKKLG